MDATAFKLRFTEEDQSCTPTEEPPLPVPPWVLRLANRRLRDGVRIGPALVNFLAHVVGTAALAESDWIDTSVPALMAAFPHVGDRTIKRWIEDLRAPLDEDQVGKTKYQRLGLLECNKRELEGEFRLTPLRPPQDGPRPAPIKAGPQQRLFDAPQEFAQSPAVPQEFVQSPAAEPILESLQAELLRLCIRSCGGSQGGGESRYADWFGEPTQWRIDGRRLTATVPYSGHLFWFKKLFRSVIGPACRTVFPGGETFELLLADSLAPACAIDGRDRPQDFAQSPAVLLQVNLTCNLSKISSKLQVQVCAPRILARAQAIAARFSAPENFFVWHWVQAAWAVETGCVPEHDLETCIAFCLTRQQPHWQFPKSIKGCFGRSNVRWLDPRIAEQRPLLIAQLANAGLEWCAEWDGTPKPKPR